MIQRKIDVRIKLHARIDKRKNRNHKIRAHRVQKCLHLNERILRVSGVFGDRIQNLCALALLFDVEFFGEILIGFKEIPQIINPFFEYVFLLFLDMGFKKIASIFN